MTVPRVRVELRRRHPGRLTGWWPAGVVAVLVAAAVTLVPSRPEVVADVRASAPGRADAAVVDSRLAAGGSGPVDAGEHATAGPDGAGQAAPAAGAAAAGDTSHCPPGGRQHDAFFHAPACLPAFVGDNGGATAQGVTGTSIRVVAFLLRCEQTTEALLLSLGFEVASCAQQEAMMRAAIEHMNRRLELYGRRIELGVRWADCPFPEDLDTCLADARAAVATRPFAVFTTFAGTYQAVWEEFARSGVVLVGGGSLSASVYRAHSPYWWSRDMSSTLQAELAADWWCRTMAGRRADHSGPVIHRSVGRRDEVIRRAGFMYYDGPAGRAAADRLTKALAACGTQLTSFAYAADISTIQQQSLAATSRFISDGVTTVLWFDFLAPTFALPEFTRQDYFPEHVMGGAGGSTADSSHRTIDSQQWRHAFGLMPEPTAVPREQGEASAVLRDGGWKGPIPPHPDAYTQGLLLLGNLIHHAGPGLTPEALRAIELQHRRGGDGSGDASGPREGFGFTATDHNGVDDVREVYWDPDATSPLDGRPGALVNVDGGARRRAGGPWAGPSRVPVSS
jgi:hypothetical protein